VDGGLMVGGFRNQLLGSPKPSLRQIAPVLVGGSDNEIGRGRESNWTVIVGGDNNRIGTNAASSVIVGPTNNVIADNASHSFASGRRSRVNHVGAFVWADSQNASFTSPGADTFNVRAQGGVRLSPQTSQFFGNTTRQMLNLFDTRYGIGVQASTTYFRSNRRFSWFRGGTHSDNQNDPGFGGTQAMTLTSGGLSVNGTFVSASDRDAKEDFRPVNPTMVLDKVLALPLHEWVYKADDEKSRHLGPTAQDFRAAFGLGVDDKHIATVDADGVALAAIQGVNQKLEARSQESTARMQELELENMELRRELAELKTLVERSLNSK
jgi:trimeric autotransporter adhesin